MMSYYVISSRVLHRFSKISTVSGFVVKNFLAYRLREGFQRDEEAKTRSEAAQQIAAFHHGHSFASCFAKSLDTILTEIPLEKSHFLNSNKQLNIIMGLSHSKTPPKIAESSFPLYCVKMLGSKHLVVAGGGGQAKTGVANRMEVFLMEIGDDDENGQNSSNSNSTPFPCHCLKTSIVDTGSRATMNLDVHVLDPHTGEALIAAGQDNFCFLYKTRYDVVYMKNGQHLGATPSANGEPASHNHSGGNSPQNGFNPQTFALGQDLKNGLVQRKLSFRVDELRKVQTDFHTKMSFQKSVRFDPKGRFFVTGGADGHFRTWDCQTGKKLKDHNAHKEEIDDVDVSPEGDLLLTVGREGKSFVWKSEDAAKVSELRLPEEMGNRYKIRLGKFTKLGTQTSSTKSVVFVTGVVPTQRSSKNQRSYLIIWVLNMKQNSCRAFTIKEAHKTEVVSCLALNQDTTLTAVGTLGGSVALFETGNLTLLKLIPQTHSIFVTGLTFLPEADAGPQSPLFSLSEDYRAGVVSISADNTTQIHCLEWEASPSFTLFLFKLFLFMALLAVFLRLIGL